MKNQTAISIMQDAERLLMASPEPNNDISENEALNDLLLLYLLREMDIVPVPLSEDDIIDEKYKKYLPVRLYQRRTHTLFLRKISYIQNELFRCKKKGKLFLAPMLTSEKIRLFYMDKPRRIICAIPQGSKRNYNIEVKCLINNITHLENSTRYECFLAAPLFSKGLFMRIWRGTTNNDKRIRTRCMNDVYEVRDIIRQAFKEYVNLKI